jgi:hypothetical protein
MSASLLVDLGATTQQFTTIKPVGAGSGIVYPASGAIIGDIVAMPNANTYCNVQIVGIPVFSSGTVRVQVQTSDDTTSGNFTDPTSGIPADSLPTWLKSGGIFQINPSTLGSGAGVIQSGGASGNFFLSGFAVAGAFLRPHTNARANILSGDFFAGSLSVTFISQLRTDGSGGGFTYSPGSGSINV